MFQFDQLCLARVKNFSPTSVLSVAGNHLWASTSEVQSFYPGVLMLGPPLPFFHVSQAPKCFSTDTPEIGTKALLFVDGSLQRQIKLPG